MKKDLKELFSKFFFRLIYSMHKNLDKIKFNKLKKLKTYFFCYQKYKKGRFHFFFLNMKKKKKENLLFNINFFSKYTKKTNLFFGKLNLFSKKIRFYKFVFFLKNFSYLNIQISKKKNRSDNLLINLIQKKFLPFFAFKLENKPPRFQQERLFFCTLDKMILKFLIKIRL